MQQLQGLAAYNQSEKPKAPRETSRSPIALTVKVMPDGDTARFVGREAWAMAKLINAGQRGITSLDNAGPRLAHYIMKIRKAGIVVECRQEPHKGDYPGWHGRYILASTVDVISDPRGIAA